MPSQRKHGNRTLTHLCHGMIFDVFASREDESWACYLGSRLPGSFKDRTGRETYARLSDSTVSVDHQVQRQPYNGRPFFWSLAFRGCHVRAMQTIRNCA